MATGTSVPSRNGTAGTRRVSLRFVHRLLRRKREQLMREAGLSVGRPRHYRRPHERPFLSHERDQVTVLLGGFSTRHDQLVQAAFQGLGYKAERIPMPVKADYRTGREYGNNGQCSPTYFTVGALVNYLKRLRDEAKLPVDQIIDKYVFMTAGACGPCRFGMYEAEYRLALRNSGFDGFRVLVFQQGDGLEQSRDGAGLQFDTRFFVSLFNAIFLGDLLNAVAFHIRPYETVPGITDDTLARCVAICQRALREKAYEKVHVGTLAGLLSRLGAAKDPMQASVLLDQLRSDQYTTALRQCAELIDQRIEVDYTRCKPVVKITGEFWAQITDGDGNFNMFSFLEREGAEALTEPIASWLTYLLYHARNRVIDRRGLTDPKSGSSARGRTLAPALDYYRKMFRLNLAQRLIVREYDRYREALGGMAHGLIDQQELARLGHPYYNSRLCGGEGHLEVSKSIYYCTRHLAHMVLSLKSFGCMPSTQSDGVQAAVVSTHPSLIFLPVETSVEGDVNAYSRVQMALGEAKVKARTEFRKALARTGYTLEEIREYVANHRELRRPSQQIPVNEGVVGRGANFVLHVGTRMAADARSDKRRLRASV